MPTFTSDQKIAMLVVPILLFGVLGVSYASGGGRNSLLNEELTLKKSHVLYGQKSRTEASGMLLRKAVETEDYAIFVKALAGTPYHESRTREVFTTLMRMYALHNDGKHELAHAYLHNVLFESSGRV